MTQPRKKHFWIVPLLILSAVLLFTLPILRLIGDSLIVVDPLRQADLITAVSGPEYRIIYAAELYKKGLGPRLFYTGGYSEENQRSEARWSKSLAIWNGVPEEAISFDDTTVISTYEEAVQLKKFIEASEEEYKTVIVVTDAYHTRRAKWAYQKVLGDQIQILMAPVPFAKTDYTKNWWLNSKSRTMVSQEYFKYAFYLLRYQLTSGSLQQWLSGFDRF